MVPRSGSSRHVFGSAATESGQHTKSTPATRSKLLAIARTRGVPSPAIPGGKDKPRLLSMTITAGRLARTLHQMSIDEHGGPCSVIAFSFIQVGGPGTTRTFIG